MLSFGNVATVLITKAHFATRTMPHVLLYLHVGMLHEQLFPAF